MTEYKFKSIEWKDDKDGGSVGRLNGVKITLECSGRINETVWCIVYDNEQYGYERGGRDNERTLEDIKNIAQADIEQRMINRYERSLDVVHVFEKWQKDIDENFKPNQ